MTGAGALSPTESEKHLIRSGGSAARLLALNLFRDEHRRTLDTIYGARDAEAYASLLGAFAATLDERVAPESKRFDAEAGGIATSRRAMFEQGLCAMPFDSNGGLSLPFGVYCLAMELAGAADASTAMSVGIHNTVAEGIFRFGSDAQRSSVFEDLIKGRRLASFSLTEPSSGSDASNMSTLATREGSGYTINGTKTFITNAGEADLYLVFAKTGDGHSAFIVERDNAGISFGPDIPKLGMKGSRTAEVRLQDCRVSADSLVGAEGRALEYVKAMLNASRIVMGSICVGIALTAYTQAVRYSTQRELFHQRLSDSPVTREKIADMRTSITAARLSCMHASRLKDLGRDFASEAAQAKLLSTEMAVEVCDRAIQMFGGYGYTDSDVHRHWRDARLLTIGEGASEVLRGLIAARELSAFR